MADYIYLMESRLSPEQQRALLLVQEVSRAHEMNVYLTGGAMRDIVSGFPIRDLDFTVQGNPFRLQKDLEKSGVVIQRTDDELRTMFVLLPGSVRAEIAMARLEKYDKPGKPPEISSATIIEDLRRRDFTANAMALSLNPGSRGLLLDPTNGIADIEAKVLRILHNYAFLEEPSRLIRATRFAARFHWALEERTQARYHTAKENDYIKQISDRAVGYEIEQIAYEEDPLHVMRALEKEDWLKVLHPRWSVGKVDVQGLQQLLRTRAQMTELGYSPDSAPAAMYFLTRRLGSSDIGQLQRLIPNKEFVNTWRNLEEDAKNLAKRLTSKEAATPSRTWNLLSRTRPEAILFLATTTRHQGVAQKIKNFLGKWRQVKQRFPLPETVELRITPELPVYPKLSEEVFLQMLDGKLRTHTELIKFLKPYSPPPPPPPPPPPRRARAAKKAEAVPPAAAAAAAPTAAPAKRGRKPKAPPVVPVAPQPAPPLPPAKPQTAPPAKLAKPKSQKPLAKQPKAKPKPKGKKSR